MALECFAQDGAGLGVAAFDDEAAHLVEARLHVDAEGVEGVVEVLLFVDHGEASALLLPEPANEAMLLLQLTDRAPQRIGR